MKTTLGLLISEIFDMFERRYGDPELAALATEVTVNDMLSSRRGLVVGAAPRAVRPPAARRDRREHRRAA
jgi:hypothetical protein